MMSKFFVKRNQLKHRRHRQLYQFIASLILLSMLGCHNPEPEWPDLETPSLKTKVEWRELSNSVEKKDTIECQVKEVEWGPEHQELNSFDPQGEVIYPGSIIDFESFDNGAYKPIIGKRKPINISISLSNISGVIPQKVEAVSLSNVRQAVQTILNTKTGGTVADIKWKEHKIYSKKHFELAVAGNYGNSFVDVAASFDFSRTEVISRFLLEFTQVYYSIDIDLLDPGIENYFYEPPKGINSNYSPVIISSVKYGRKVFICVESKEKSFDQNSSLVASFSSFWGSGGIMADQNINELLKEKAIKGIILGGSASAATQVIVDINELKNYLLSGANYSNYNLGIPLSYNLRFIHDNSIAKLVQYDKFFIRDCKIIPGETIKIPAPSDNLISKECPEIISGGDRDFVGHGPYIYYKVELDVQGPNNDQLWYKVKLTLTETVPNLTAATDEWTGKLYSAPNGKKIQKILSKDIESRPNEEDTNGTKLNQFPYPEEFCARLIEIQGDTAGNDVGACTGDDSFISVFWNPIMIVLRDR